jgi:hypothetical protein
MCLRLEVHGTDWAIMLHRGLWWAMNLAAKRLGPFDNWRDALRAAQAEEARWASSAVIH